MNKFKTLIFLLLASATLFAQEIEIPKDIKLDHADDFRKVEPLVLRCIDWLVQTPIIENSAKRKEINAFLLRWMGGSPDVSIELVAGIMPSSCADCLMAFLCGWTKYSLENNYSKNNVQCALAGVENAIAFYEKNKSELGKNSEMEKFIKHKRKGKLEKYIESKLDIF